MQWLALMIAVFIWLPEVADATVIKIPRPGIQDINSPSYYPEALLTLALHKTVFAYGDFQLAYVGAMHSSDRLRAMLIGRQGLDVMWSTATPAREREMQALEHDIFRGLNGYRRLIIRAADRVVFTRIKSREDLQKLKAGVGAQWSDKLILAHNQLPFVVGTRLDFLGKMLAVGRFDYLSRSVHEYHYDLHDFNNPQLTVAPQLILHYCQPVKFFVSKQAPHLADRIELGLALALADGSADELFYGLPALQRARAELQQPTNRIVELDNPHCRPAATH